MEVVLVIGSVVLGFVAFVGTIVYLRRHPLKFDEARAKTNGKSEVTPRP